MIIVLILLIFFIAPSQSQADLLFDGTNDTVTGASNAGAPQTYPVTVTAIVSFTSVTGLYDLAGVGTNQTTGLGGYIFITNASTGQLLVWNPSSTFVVSSAAGAFVAGNWYYLAWSAASATSHRFYAWNYTTRAAIIDGTVATNLGALAVSTASVKIGHSLNSSGVAQEFFGGTMRQVAYYNKDWTANADPFRAMAYLGPTSLATPTLLYNFQSITGSTTVREQQASTNVGTLANFTGTFWVPMQYPRAFWVN